MQKYCSRCRTNITYQYTYSQYCRDCKARNYNNVPEYVPDSQVNMYIRLEKEKNV